MRMVLKFLTPDLGVELPELPMEGSKYTQANWLGCLTRSLTSFSWGTFLDGMESYRVEKLAAVVGILYVI